MSSSGKSNVSSSLDRSSSFREKNTENLVLSFTPSMSRNGSVVAQKDVIPFLKSMRFDPKLVVSELKIHQQGEFKRSMNVALGILPDKSPNESSKGKLIASPLHEEVKRVRASLHESSIKARERGKIFHDALAAFNNYFPNVPSRKRSRSNVLPSQKTNMLLSSDPSVLGPPCAGKKGMQNYTLPGVFDDKQQKSVEVTDSAVPKKRLRTSLMDLKTDKKVVVDERANSIGIDGWEKLKMKKKRSGIKPYAPHTLASDNPIDGYRESKQRAHQNLVTDTRSRLNNDSHEFRNWKSSDSIWNFKQPSFGMRSSVRISDLDNSSHIIDISDLPTGSEKGRVTLGAINKTNKPDDSSFDGPTSTIKMNASAGATRSDSSGVPKSTPILVQPVTPNEWEIPHGSVKHPASVGANNCKRTPSPYKISHTARRTNFTPIAPKDEDTEPKKSLHKVSSAAIAESADTIAIGIKSRVKCEIYDEIEEKPRQSVQKMFSMRKKKVDNREDLGDGIQKQGRTECSFMVEKHSDVGVVKQIRNVGLGVHKRAGRSPTRKLSDRKVYTRQKNPIINAVSDFVGVDDEQKELLATVKAVINTSHSFTCSFWRQMEKYFRFMSDTYIAYLRQEVNLESADSCATAYNENMLNKCERDTSFASGAKYGVFPESLILETSGHTDITLYQTLLAALITDVESEDILRAGNEDLMYESELGMDAEFEPSSLNYQASEDCQYDTMSIDNRILMEIHNLGIFPEVVPNWASSVVEDIIEDILKLEDMYQLQVSEKKSLLDGVLKFVIDKRPLQEKELEQRAVDKHIEMTYQKYMRFRGGKSSSTKIAKKTSLVFVERTMERCREFEDTGKSCFSETRYMDMLLSGFSRVDETHSADTPKQGSTGNKRERNRDGKGKSREILSVNKNTNIAWPSPSTVKRKTESKAKSKKKTTQTSASGFHGNASEQPKPVLDILDDIEAMDVLGCQGQDLDSWLNIDDDGLQDEDTMGLEIPMDDLTDLKMIV